MVKIRSRLLGRIDTLSAYLKIIEAHCGDDDYFFRGQREDWPMVPKLARLTPRTDRGRDEQSMVDDFRRQVAAYREQPNTDWDLLSIAQHHGMATRLLDWTSSSLFGLWFAVEQPATNPEQPAVVYLIGHKQGDLVQNLIKESPFGRGRTKFFKPRAITTRIRAQQGFFSVHRYVGADTWVPLQQNLFFKARLKKIEIPATAFCDLRFELDRCGINRASMFPDLDGLCTHLTWSYTMEKDESSD